MNTTQHTNGLATRAMLASLTVRRWAGTKTDKAITSEVARTHAVAAKRAGHYRKHAINIEAKSFKAVVAAASEIRTEYYKLTLPWGQDGARILSAANFAKFSESMRHLKDSFAAAADLFAADYPQLCAEARAELNGMYDATDYPSDIRSKFGVSVSIAPLPQACDFRVALPPEALQEIRTDLEASVQETLQAAMREPYQRLHDHLARMVERLSQPDATFRDTLVTGLDDICEGMAGLNLTGDPILTDLTAKAATMIASVHPQTLRDSPTVRSHVAQQAADIMATMASMMGAA